MYPLIPWMVGGAAVYAGLRWFEWHNTFKPSRAMTEDPSKIGLAFEDVMFFAEDGCRLHGWWIPHPEATGAMLYCHGNAGNISTRLDVVDGLHKLGVHVFLFDYRGFGLSRGIPSERGLYRDARAAYEVVRARFEDADQPPVIVFGASLGGSVAAQLAVDKPVKGVVIEGGFTSSVDVGERWYPNLPIRTIARYRFDAQSKLASLPVPKLFAHSTIDGVVPYDIGTRLFEAASGPKQFIPLRGNHGEAGWIDTPAFYTALHTFVRSIFSAAGIQ